jgi:DNA-binding response OmpR family regulator
VVIDDEPAVRRMVCKELQMLGHQTFEAENGLVGMETVRREQPHVVITDLVMPVQEGIETILQLNALDPRPAVIAMSGASGGAGFSPLDDAGHLGADFVLAKPFGLRDLLAAVERVLPSGH